MSDDISIDRVVAGQSVTIDGRKYSYRELLGIDDADLSYEFATQASRFAFVAAQAGIAESRYEQAKSNRDVVYAEIDRDIRKEFHGEKITEPKIKHLILSDEEFMDVVEAEHKGLKEWRVLKALSDGLKQRGEMLRSLGAQLRTEYDVTDMSVKRRLSDAKDRKSRG